MCLWYRMRDGAGVEDVKIRTKILDWCKEQQSCESCISDKEKQNMTTSSHQLHFFFLLFLNAAPEMKIYRFLQKRGMKVEPNARTQILTACRPEKMARGAYEAGGETLNACIFMMCSPALDWICMSVLSTVSLGQAALTVCSQDEHSLVTLSEGNCFSCEGDNR